VKRADREIHDYDHAEMDWVDAQ